ncbi:hypothetical protein [Exiguobacterium sp. AB2]|uniref:hypothetical protein n=1 Tax=Exiguobacterium sp. AB2 TaxID=1484479 RepID=UPI000AD11EEA|nr:hypothetical protein [Exiguobacterium sp. AB2]
MVKEEVRTSRAASRKRKRLLRTLMALVLMASLVGVIALAALMDSKDTKTALPETDEIATEMVGSDSEEEPLVEEAKDVVYIGAPYTKVYADDRVTVVYEADLGDRYERLETVSGFVKLQLNERLTGWVTEERVTTETSAATDEEITSAWQSVMPAASASTLELLGKDRESVRAELGAPKAVQRDQVNEYHFYDGFFLMMRDGKVKAIDWDKQPVASPELKASSDQASGSWYEGETMQLKLFPYSGIMRVRVEQK